MRTIVIRLLIDEWKKDNKSCEIGIFGAHQCSPHRISQLHLLRTHLMWFCTELNDAFFKRNLKPEP
jgi:hypothetical protein